MVAIPRNPNNPWKVVEYYDGGGAKSYQHDVTGETLSRAQYRKLKDNGYSQSEAFDAPPELDASPEVDVPPPPKDRAWQTFGELGGKVDAATSSLWQKVAPGLYSIFRGGSKIILTRMDRTDIADYIPPGEIVTPILKPATRILDRHFPLRIAVQGSEDLGDIVAMIAATEKLIDYISAVTAEHMEAERAYYEQYGEESDGASADDSRDGRRASQAPSTGASDRTPSGRERQPRTGARAAMERFSTWRDSIRPNTGADEEQQQRHGRGPGGLYGDVQSDHDRRTENYANEQTARNAASIRNLLERDADGRARKGLG